jgi:hypothetical protein
VIRVGKVGTTNGGEAKIEGMICDLPSLLVIKIKYYEEDKKERRVGMEKKRGMWGGFLY